LLPIWAIHEPAVRVLTAGNRLVLVAPTGSGKTTQIPQMLLDAGLAGDRQIVVLQPRRVAARSVAARVASERRVRLGDEVGYQIRFDDQTSAGTRISFVTEGILLRWLQQDSCLRRASIILFDEFHERSLLGDVALALVKRVQETTRPDLKLVVMSATLDAEPVAAYLATTSTPGPAPTLIAGGTSFPVETRHLSEPDDRPVGEQAAGVVEEIVNGGAEGDILVFMPGMAEISATANALRCADLSEPVAIIPLHGDLPPEEQDRAFSPHPRRKVVIATNVAETSVTIDGIRHVVDSGLARVSRYDPERGISTLLLEPISRASAAQRQGRAGRTAPGVCHRLWTESGHLNRPEANTPEIQRSDLAEVVLLLHSLGIRRAVEFDWLDRPNPTAVERAEILLRTLGALTSDPAGAAESDLTPVGRRMLALPMHPRYARMLVEAEKLSCVPQAALCAALVSGRDLLARAGRDDRQIREAREVFEASQDSDFLTLMRAFQFAKQRHFDPAAVRRYGIHAQTARQVQETFQQIMGMTRRVPSGSSPGDGGENPPPASSEPLLRCVMAGFIDQLCVRRDQGSLECDLTEGRSGTLVRESVVQNARMFVAASIREVEGRGATPLTLLGLASAVQPEWVGEVFPGQVSSRIEHVFDRTHKRVAAVRLTSFRDLVFAIQHQREPDPAAAGRCLAEAYRSGCFELPLLNHEARQWIGRVNTAALAMPELEIASLDGPALIACLAGAFAGLTLAKEAQATPLKEALIAHLRPGQREWVQELAPATVPWPDGRKLKLLYAENQSPAPAGPEPPELQVKLQECFALAEHPRVCDGKVPIRLWLCTPDGKRLASTTDWPGFRSGTYPKLRASLQRSHPGTAWL